MFKEAAEKTLDYACRMSCLFCGIANREIPAAILYEDEQVMAFADIAPQAPVHLLLIPRQHLSSLAHTAREHAPVLGHLLAVAAEQASAHHLEHGYRVVINAGAHGGQTVDHLHLHVLGGRALSWPPG